MNMEQESRELKDVASKHRQVVPCVDHFKEEHEKQSKNYANNKVRTTKYTVWNFIPKNLLEQFHRVANLYFLFIAVLNWIPVVEAFQKEITMMPLLVVLTIIAVKDSLEDYRKHKSDKKLNHLLTKVYSSKERGYIDKFWKDVTVGDFIHLSCNEEIPADLVLLYSTDADGICHIETSSLDGESNLKQRQVVRGYEDQETELDPGQFTSKIECETPNNDLSSFRGFIEHSNQERVGLSKENLLLRGCTIRNTEAVVGIVVYAGHETKTMLNNMGPRHKRSKLEKRVNGHILWCVLLLIVMCSVAAVGHWFWLNRFSQPPIYSVTDSDGNWVVPPALSAFYLFWRMIILLQVMIPVSLYVSIEFVKLGQIYFILNDIDFYHEKTDTTIQCRALNIAEDLGQIEYLFTDKTGTLTENKMVFRRCTIAGREYGHEENAKRLEKKEPDSEDEDRTSSHTMRHVSRVKMSTLLSSKFLHQGPGSSFAMGSSHMRQLAFSSPIETDVVPDIKLMGKFNRISRDTYERSTTQYMTSETVYITEFFISLAICNTVVVSTPEQPSQKRFWPSTPKVLAPLDEFRKILNKFSIRKLSSCSPAASTSSKAPQSDDAKNIRRKLGFSGLRVRICSTDIQSPVELPSSDVSTDIPSSDVPKEGAQKEVVVEGGGNPGETLKERSGSAPGPVSELSSESQLCYEAESPDEAALVHAARAYSCILESRGPDQVTIDFAALGPLTFQLLHILPFDAVRKRMSVVVRHPIWNQVVVYTKGADSVIMDLLQTEPTGIEKVDRQNQKIKEKTKRHLDEYASKGLRTLCIASKVMSDSEYQEWLKEHYEAESDIDHREERLLESALRLEKNLTLLGRDCVCNRDDQCFMYFGSCWGFSDGRYGRCLDKSNQGATGIEDRLQEGVPETIASLRKAGISIWMLTGDKQETAVNIAHSCQLLEPTDTLFTLKSVSQEDCEQLLDRILEEMKICPQAKGSCSTDDVNVSGASVAPIPQLSAGLIIDGPTLAFALNETARRRFLQLAKQVRAVICCRATPLQKSQLVTVVRKELEVMTLAIGDGANDVSMIQVADVGIGVSGQEGMQAVMASDFAISEFKHLNKLLLVHGHWCYTRLANMVLYFFYKNLAYVALLFWYQFFCGFSGMSMTDHWSLIFFNLLFTSAPPIVYGLMDKDVSANVLLRMPQLYRASQRSEPYVSSAFVINLLDAFYQSLACFFICYMTYADSDTDIFSFGEPLDTSIFFIIILHLVIESKSLNWIHMAVLLGSVVLYLTFTVFLGAFCVLCNPPANPYGIMQRHLRDPTFYLVCLMSILVALFPRYIFRVLQGTIFPTPVMRARQMEWQSQGSPKTHRFRNRVAPV